MATLKLYNTYITYDLVNASGDGAKGEKAGDDITFEVSEAGTYYFKNVCIDLSDFEATNDIETWTANDTDIVETFPEMENVKIKVDGGEWQDVGDASIDITGTPTKHNIEFDFSNASFAFPSTTPNVFLSSKGYDLINFNPPSGMTLTTSALTEITVYRSKCRLRGILSPLFIWLSSVSNVSMPF